MKDLERFWAKVERVESGCHEWQSTIHRDGYGKFWFNGKQVQAHRVAYILQVGEIGERLHVLHRCDNRKCVNPAHLYLGTPKQNTQDKIDRCGWHGNMRFPFDVVERARELYKTGMTQQKIADELGIHQTQVSRYINGKQRLHK